LNFADVIAELKDRYRAELERVTVKWQRPTDAEEARLIAEVELRVPPAPRDERYITDEDIERWAAEVEISVEALFDGIAMYLARGFHTGTLSFAFCDRVVNHLNLTDHAKNGPSTEPTLFWAVYLAFDAGEYWRPGDDRDPIISYTRPDIGKIVEENVGFRYPDASL
jgi:hypothetical protein